MKKNSRLKSFFAILLAVSMIFQQSSLTVLATDDTYVEDATATPTPSENEAETYATEGAEPVAEKQEEPQQVQETPAAEQAQEPTEAPAEQPTEAPAEQPTEAPAEQPTEAPAAAPTETPATEPTAAPAAEVTEAPAAPEATATPAAEATATPTPEVSAPPSETPTPTPEVTETPAETTEFSDVSVDNAIANVSLSTPISEKAIFVAKQYDEDSEYFDNAIGAVMNWAGQNNLALTEAVVYDLHFENEDGTPYPYGDNATVNLQFNNPILNELEYDNVENVKTYVLHITENGVQDVNGGIAQNGSGAVTGVTIQTNGFSPFVIVKAGSGAVMAVQEGLPSTSLADFITDVKFTDAKTDENGKLILSIGSEYSFDMSFAEVPGVRQLDVENNLVLEYPTQLTPSVQSGTFDIEVIKGKNKYIVSGNTYEVINNKVVVKINKNDTNYEHLKDASNVAFNLHLKAKVSENATGKEIKFNDQVKKDVTFKSDASVSVEKTGTYDKTRGKFIYTVKVTSTGTSKNVKVTDRITGTLLKYADDVVASPDKGSVSATPINNGFVYEIPTMNDGEVITLTYSADIDYSKLPKGAKSFTVDETKNTVSAKGDNTPKSDDKSKDFNNETIATPIKKSGKAEEVKDGKQTSTWTIIVNEDANEYVGGSTVTDILKQNDKAPTDYSGGGLTVNIYNKNGDKVGTETPLWGNGVTKTESGWTYNLPKNANNTPYKYEIIYTTVTDISSVYQDNLKIENEAEHNGESTSGEVSPISKGDKFEVTKDHENATKDSVDWTVTIKIPDTGFNNSFSVTDSLPFTWNNGVPCKDSYMAGTMKVDWNGTTLVEGTHYSINPEDTGSNSIQLKLNFKNVVQLFPKVNAGTNRTLTLTYKTKPDSNWPESESHNNTVTVSGDGTDKTDTDSYKLSEHKIKKEVDGTRTIDGMPAFGFKVQLQGVDSDTITISDNFFDTELFEVYVGRSDVWGMMRFGGGDKPEEAEAAANGKSLGGTVSATPTSTGADFTITNVAKKGNSYYNYYVLRYFLKVKDVAALKKLQQMAADSENHTALISNIATWGDISSEKVSHTFELKPVTKETVDVGSGNDYKASFKIVINPDKLKLNGGNQIDVKDVITVTEGAGAKVRLIPDSLKITLDPAGDYSTDYSEDRTTLNIKIPDECKATITYDAKVDGKGTVKYNNTVDISGGYTASSGEKTVYIESIAGGTAEVFAYTLVKRDAKTKAALNGAKFQLFDVTDNKLLTAFDAKKNRIPLVFTTNENGIVEIRHSDETVSGWSLIEGHRYRLEEIEAPDGYGIADPVTFTVVSSKANAGETIPADGIFNGEEIDVYDAKAEEVDLTATKELTGRNLKDGEFSFELTPDSHNPASDKNAKKTVQNTADGNISFGKLKFTEAGTYKYTVSEITGNDDTITYDNKSYTVTIVVEEGEHGALNIASKTITLNSGAKSEIKFTNAYTPKPTTAQIEAEKSVNGEAATGSQFHFTLTPKTDGDKNEAKNVTNVNGKITFADLTYDKAGTYEYEVAEVQENLPNGYKADKTVYTATVTITDNKETGKLEAVVSYKKGEKSVDKLTFANTYKAEGTTAEIEAEKTVNGEAATGSQFHFTLTPKTDGDKNRSQNVTNVDGKITFADLTYDRDGIYEYEVAEVQEVPNGYTADKTVYKVTVTVTDDMSGQLKAAVSYKKAEEPVDKLTFANIYKASVDLQLKAQKSMKVEAEQLGTFEFELKDADGKVIETVKNDEKGAISFSKLSYTEKDAGRTFAYTVNEKIPLEADTYIYDKTVYTVTVNVEDNRDGTLKLTTKVNGKDYTATAMKFVNDSTKVTITKVNDTDRNALLGAKLQIVDAKDKVVEEWTTDGNPHVIIGKLILGETYKLVEKEAPNGYKIADPITFVMQSDGTITVNAKPVSENQLTMVDSKLHFNVNKVELGSGKEVEGAHLVVIDKETGKTVDEWVSEKDKTHDFGPKLEAGKSYILRETVAPAGYKYATDIEFTVKKDGTIETNAKTTTDTDGNKVYLVEDDTTKVTITKVDALGNQLSGVVLEIQDKDGMVIDTWTTSTKDNPHVITGKLILGETYKLVEKSAPAGYTLADPVEFTVSENDIDNKVEMKNIYSASGSLNLTAKKILTTTETPLAAGQFTFELRDKDGTVLQTKTNDADGNVTFDQIKYNLVKDAAYKDNTDKKVDNTGEYQYTVNEVKGDAAGYTYDDTIYTINVTVTDAGNGTLTVTPVIHSSKATSEDATATGMEFTNTYTTSGQIVLGATKTLEGQTLEAEQFSFQATEMDVDGKAVENGYSETVKNADGGAITFPIITYKESGTHYYQITEVKDEKPAYQYDESKYVVKVDVTDDNAGKLTAKVTSVTKNGELVKSEDLIGAVTFTNTYSASADLELKAQKSMKVEAEQLGTFEFELKDADGKVIETVKNDEKGAISFSKLSYTEKDAGKTFTYTVNEKLPSEADTYVYDKTVYTVTVNVEDNRDGTLKLTTKVNGGDYTETVMKFVNDTTKVTISKVDDTTLKALAGAKLQVVDDQDKVVEEWTSDGTPHVITAKLVLGKTYKLVEEEAPSGYEIAEPITFTVDADDTKNAVEMKDAMTKGKTAAIEITKELKLNDALAGAKDMTFYAALFADAECTISASDVKALEFKNASSSTVTFTNLDLGRTYYVSETDATGKAIDSGMTPDEKVYVPVYPQGQAITVTEDGAKSSITFENQFSEWPDGFYKIATLNVTKKLLGAAGNALESDEIFYAGIFDDKECTTLSTRTEKNILTLDLAGGSTVSESTQAVVIPDEAFTLYVAETDAEGNLVDGTEGFRYAVTVENGNVLFDENNLNAEVTIINQEQPEATPTVTPEETITPTPTPGTSTGVKTGDDTPIGFYMALLFVAALAIEETTRRRRKKEQD
ncbi:MAG: FctA domain-containing protein [Blautia faecis]|nr:FctA domain-containing protein [Blautia faecis]